MRTASAQSHGTGRRWARYRTWQGTWYVMTMQQLPWAIKYVGLWDCRRWVTAVAAARAWGTRGGAGGVSGARRGAGAAVAGNAGGGGEREGRAWRAVAEEVVEEGCVVAER